MQFYRKRAVDASEMTSILSVKGHNILNGSFLSNYAVGCYKNPMTFCVVYSCYWNSGFYNKHMFIFAMCNITDLLLSFLKEIMPAFQVQIITPSHGCFCWFHVQTTHMRYGIHVHK